MYHLVLAYQRSTQTVLESKSFPGWELASEHRRTLDAQHWGNWDVEVVTLSSTSREALEQTHGRYFCTIEELADRVTDAARESGRGHLRALFRPRKAAVAVA